MLTLACGLASALPVSAQPTATRTGQAYPFKPLRIIVPYASGAGPDFTAREIARSITEATGQPVVTDNRPGAAATLGHAMAAKAAPDGYTLLLGTLGGLVSGPALLGNKIPYQVSITGLLTTMPQGYHDQIRSDLQMWRKLISDSKITVDSLP